MAWHVALAPKSSKAFKPTDLHCNRDSLEDYFPALASVSNPDMGTAEVAAATSTHNVLFAKLRYQMDQGRTCPQVGNKRERSMHLPVQIYRRVQESCRKDEQEYGRDRTLGVV